ncbi:hypothetical protein [Pontibacter harenae]|uniref:hypothetical protein n=1 Tax=Pontibacter harenae TaxID=2894083 RepID=UPI001E5B1D0E|nr:hypothetical protein [Pontibacter harenae]MCC9168837.1 hypothetical protein [Pontibacter harenae]
MKKHFIRACYVAALVSSFYACTTPAEEEGIAEFAKIHKAAMAEISPGCEMITFEPGTYKRGADGFVTELTSSAGSGPVLVSAFRKISTSSTYQTKSVANVFDSFQAKTVQDQEKAQQFHVQDLLTPNTNYGGFGIGVGGASTAYANDRNLGNLLIINRSDNFNVAYDYSPGGKMIIDFSNLGTVTLKAVTVIDIDSYEAGSEVRMYGTDGELLKAVPMEVSGDNGVQVLNLGDTKGVQTMEVYLGLVNEETGSAAIDNIEFCRELPEEPKTGCTRTQGYWKTHSQSGPAPYDATWSKIGPAAEKTPFFNSGMSYIQIMQKPVQGNGYYNLAHQYIAAKLNMYTAYASDEVMNAFNQATTLLSNHSSNVVAVKSNKKLNAEFVKLAGILDAYNNGNLGTAHCDDTSSAKAGK